jgi:(2R)-sulfolactate sulfo-lyase subunit alpha
MPVQFLVHNPEDNVGVAVVDIGVPGPAVGGFRDSDGNVEVSVAEPVPLGHKVALRDVAKGAEVIEYGVPIGVATADIGAGQLVHIHNLKGQRWA